MKIVLFDEAKRKGKIAKKETKALEKAKVEKAKENNKKPKKDK